MAAVVSLMLAASAQAYVPGDRWTATASGFAGAQGTPITLTWSLIPDGTTIPNREPSNLISYLDEIIGGGSGSSALTERPWFTLLEQSLARWGELGGITFVYEPADDGLQLATFSGALGVRGDIRIGGTMIDGPGSTLAYAHLPNNGDIVFDTGETTYFANPADNFRRLRNTLMHEVGHAFGLLHVESSSEVLLMEPAISSAIDGPQLDDIRGIQGMYGDAFEKTNGGLGNGTFARASGLGSLVPGGSLAVGSDAIGGQAVSSMETDFVSISTNTDVDFYSFSISAPLTLSATLTPLGGTFSQGVEGGEQSLFDANSRNDLALALFAPNGTTLLASADNAPAGGIESLVDITLDTPGQYYMRVTGADDAVQLYQLLLSAVSLLPGDFDGDGMVAGTDLSLLLNDWGSAVPPTPQGWAGAAPTGPAVDNDELRDLLNNWGQSASGAGGIASAGSVPEPASVLLLAMAAAALAIIRRRQTSAR